MNRLILLLGVIVTMQSFAQAPQAAKLLNPKSKKIYVASHRCDWRNYPENSIAALESSIKMGVDIAEVDLKMTKDSVLILMHDATINRTTTGKGKPEDYTFEEIKKFKLKNGLGRASNHCIPTLREFLEIAKGRIIIDIDKGYEYLPHVIKLLRETGTLSQAIVNINDNTTLDEVESIYGKIPEDITLMPILAYKDKERAKATLQSYLLRHNTIFQPVWDNDNQIEDEDFKKLRKKGYGVWFNSLWDSLCGGHDDDRSVEQYQPDETWGWLIRHNANIIQTDRPLQLIEYLRKKSLLK